MVLMVKHFRRTMSDPESCLCFIPDNVPLTLPTSRDHIREVNWFTGASETKKVTATVLFRIRRKADM